MKRFLLALTLTTAVTGCIHPSALWTQQGIPQSPDCEKSSLAQKWCDETARDMAQRSGYHPDPEWMQRLHAFITGYGDSVVFVQVMPTPYQTPPAPRPQR